jgi:leucyl-tRNA synthetase
MFMGPLEQIKPWSTSGVDGVHRFLNRAWRLMVDEDSDSLHSRIKESDPNDAQLRTLHLTIRKVTDDVESLRFNTAIAAMMEFVNAANKWDELPRSIAEQFVLILSPFAPHIAEELWSRLGHADSLAYESWPRADERYLKADTIEVAVQVNGKVRGSIQVPPDISKEEALTRARSEENVARHLEGKSLRKEIYVPGRIVSFVVG